jgi:hypothetical protein
MKRDFLRIPKKFSARTMLVFVALVAVAIVVIRDQRELRRARKAFDHTWTLFMANIADHEAVASASAALANVEAASPWISIETAKQRHIVRLYGILRVYDHPFSHASPESRYLIHRFVHESVDQFKSDGH